MRICLSMIVRDESAVIERSLLSIKPHLHSFAIIDTGSSDDTIEKIRKILEGIPGEVLQQPWRDEYDYHRNQALDLARAQPGATHALFLDADDECVIPIGYDFPEDEDACPDGYRMFIRYPGGMCEFRRPALVRLDRPWKWTGVRHEYLALENATTWQMDGPYILVHPGEGARSRDPLKYLHDAEAIEKALLNDPGNTRYLFYLGQSLKDAGLLERAIIAYQARVENLFGFNDERWYSQLMIGRAKITLRKPREEIEAAFTMAHEIHPRRAETFGTLAEYLRIQILDYSAAYQYARKAMDIPIPMDGLFVERHWYDWRAQDEMAVSAFYCGKYRESLEGFADLVRKGQHREHEGRWGDGIRFALDKMHQAGMIL